ncbi:hypothetical protein K440DRAFT_643757 [Wilcoxina mikolae CBS 423.85]|nr:hypothetical protein K440DRAFT_643757 [Wilcoxina mikolae CBS 423.85]
MSRPQLLTPFWRRADQHTHQEDRDHNRPPTSRAHTAARKEVESAVSIGTGQKIQKILDEGNAIYLGVDPRDCGRILRHSMQASGSSGRKENLTFEANDEEGRISHIFKKLLCGLSLDCAAKFVLVIGLYLGGHILLSGLGAFVARKSVHGGFTIMVAVLQVVWGLYFGAACLFGMSMMWGKWKRSPTAALFFIMIWTLTTFLVIVAAGIWLYFFYAARAIRIQHCNAKTVRVSPRMESMDSGAPRRGAPKDRIETCIQMAMKRGTELLIYGIVHVIMACFCVVVIAWGKEYRDRLLKTKEFDRLQNEIETESEEVGLLIGTAPLGMRGKRALEPTREEDSRSSIYSTGDDDPVLPRLGDTRRQTMIITGSGVLPISARHSELYTNPLPQAATDSRKHNNRNATLMRIL